MRIHESTDHAELSALEQRLQNASDRLSGLVRRVSVARQCREYDSDRRKKALATAMLPFIEAGDSASASECKARASYGYAREMKVLGEQLAAAELAIAEWDAAKCAFGSAQSLLATARELTRM